MNEKVKPLWTTALRSGEYQQGKFCLKNQDGKFCCLGVLVDLYCKETGQVFEEFISFQRNDTAFGLHENLPGPVMKWAGLSEANPNLNGETCIYENDIGNSFDYIAGLIEKGL